MNRSPGAREHAVDPDPRQGVVVGAVGVVLGLVGVVFGVGVGVGAVGARPGVDRPGLSDPAGAASVLGVVARAGSSSEPTVSAIATPTAAAIASSPSHSPPFPLVRDIVGNRTRARRR